MSRAHKKLERNINLMAIFIIIVVSIGGAVEILPLVFQGEARTPAAGITPYPPLELAGRDIYIREGCYGCHSQMIRPFRSETERYGPYSVAGESVYDRPFQWGSKRTGPDLARVGGRYSDDWHRIHLINPRDVVPESNMPGYPWLESATVDAELVKRKMRALRKLGDPYTDAQIDEAGAQLEGRTEMDAVIAYLQGLGTARSGR
jgi:cytochrome c oxidase cbb3-type subunit 2